MSRHYRVTVAVVVFTFVAHWSASPFSLAATHSWTGGSPFGSNWTDTANWTLFDAPNSNGTDDITFGPIGAPRLTSTVDVNHNINTVVFHDEIPFLAPSFTINGSGRMQFRNSGAGIYNLSQASQTISAPILLVADDFTIWNNDLGVGALTINSNIDNNTHDWTVTAGVEAGIRINGVISGSGLLSKYGAGELVLAGANTYSGGTNIVNGTLRTAADNRIPPGPVLILGGATLDLSNRTETIGPGAVNVIGLTMGINSGTSEIKLGATGNMTISTLGVFVNYQFGAEDDAVGPARITGGSGSQLRLATSSATRQFYVGDSSATSEELTITAPITNLATGATPDIYKWGPGRMVLTANNVFSRGVDIAQGPLQIRNAGALGLGGAGDPDYGTTVSFNSSLELSGGIDVAEEHLRLNGDGDQSLGALRSISGDNRWGGPVVLVSNSTVAVDADSLTIYGNISGAASLDKVGAGALLLNGTNTHAGGTTVSDGTLGGNGSLVGLVTVETGAALAPGTSVGTLTVNAVKFDPGSTLAIEILGAGGVAGTDFDQLVVNGAAMINGATLDVDLVAPFTPQAGNEFQILNFGGSVSGTGFSAFDLPPLDAGLRWQTSDLLATGILSVVVALDGDYNENGVVDAADYTVWRNNLGSGTTLPNDDTPGVDTDDYDRWKDHFGESSGNGSSARADAAVPEPTSLTLLALALCALALLRRN